MPRTIRRVITTEDAEGRSTVLADGPASATIDIVEGLRLSDIWTTSSREAALAPQLDVMAGEAVDLMPPTCGTKFRLFELPPDGQYLDRVSGEDLLGGIGGGDKVVADDHPGMHKTPTIDYLVVLSGRVVLILETGEVELGPGDCVVQGGVNHAWSNRSAEPALLAAVLVSAS